MLPLRDAGRESVAAGAAARAVFRVWMRYVVASADVDSHTGGCGVSAGSSGMRAASREHLATLDK